MVALPSRPQAWLLVTPLVAALAGCFPIHETYRPAIVGAVVDRDQHPVPGAQVVACSASHWQGFAGCPRRGETTTDGDGRFSFAPLVELEWCCFGEAPLPSTLLTACAKDAKGRALQAPATPARAGGADHHLELALPEHPIPAGCTPEPRKP